jgi:outer membrane protein assembly factor BamB
LSQLVTYVHNRNLTAVDPISGDVVWTRNDLQPGSSVFGDDEMLFVSGPRNGQATVLRSLDGAEIGKRAVPSADERMTHFGNRVVSWSIRDEHAVLEMVDVWEETPLWSYEFDVDAKVWLVDSEAVGVMQNDGQFMLITLPDGKPLVDEPLEPEPELAEIYVLKSRDRYTLVANRPRVNRGGFQVHAVPSGYGNPLVNGRMYCFHPTTGQRLWKEPVEIEDQALLLRQPSELPVFVFVCQQYEYRDRRRGNGQGKILCIDKRTGRVVLDHMLPAAISNFEVSAQPPENLVRIGTPVSSIELKFTGQPWPEPPPLEGAVDDEAEGTSAGKAVLRGLRTLAETITGPTRDGQRNEPRDEPAEIAEPADEERDEPVFDIPLNPFDERF